MRLRVLSQAEMLMDVDHNLKSIYSLVTEKGEFMKTVYEKLQNKLDNMATGYPKTESRIELKILKTSKKNQFLLEMET